MRFIDEVSIKVVSGKGGEGHISFRKEKYVSFGGPDGGDGGVGGSVFLEAVEGMNTLSGLRGRRVYSATDGERGGRKQMTGRGGQDLTIKVPVGTIVRDSQNGTLLADLVHVGDRVMVAKGGYPGKGNMAFKSSTNRAPMKATKGGPGETLELALELKLLADVGVIGFPNAGKSTWVSGVSQARPRIADYPFTTLVPSLGVVSKGWDSFVVADVPGLIEGAAMGAGLGHQFLRHIQRTKLLLHLVSVAHEDQHKPIDRYFILRNELKEFDPELAERREVVALSKIDSVDTETLEEIKATFENKGIKVILISTVTGAGMKELEHILWESLKD